MQYNIDASKLGKRNAKPATSGLSKAVDRACKNIATKAVTDGKTVEETANDLLKNYSDILTQYVSVKGESPSDTQAGLITQAALIRANDIATMATAAGIGEDDAMREIEKQESFAKEMNTADKDDVMPANLQAALKVVIDGFQTRMQNVAKTGDLQSALALVKKSMATPLNDFDGETAHFGSIIKVATGGEKPDYIDFDVSGLKPVDVASLETPVNADAGGDFWSILDKIAGTATTISGAIKSIGGTATNTAGTVANIFGSQASDVGSDSIQKYVSRNWLYILLFVIVIAVIIILLSRAVKR